MGIKVSNTCELTFGDSGVGGGEAARGWLLGEVHNGIAQMFQVIENARMMVGTKAIATLSTGYLNALEYAKTRVQGADLDPGRRQDRPARHDHPPPRRTPLADGAEVLLRGDALAGALHRVLAGPGADRRAQRRDRRAGHAGQRPAAADRQGLRLGALVGAARHRVAADLRRLRLPAGVPASSSTSATPRSTPSTRAPPRSRARTSSSARSSRTRPRRWATSPARSTPSSRARPATVASRSSASCWRSRLEDAPGAGRPDDQHPDERRRVGRGRRHPQHLQGRAEHLPPADGARRRRLRAGCCSRAPRWRCRSWAARSRPADKAFYEGKVAAAQFFAQHNLPKITAELAIAEATDLSLMDLDEASF